MEQGQSVVVVVAGFGGQTGEIQLNISQAPQ
jgi:hypothetical protein